MLTIDFDKIHTLKITKVKPWKIYFEYDYQKYVIVECDNEDNETRLYHRIPINECGAYKNKLIKSRYRAYMPNLIYISPRTGMCKPYAQNKSLQYIDIYSFIWQMTWNDFIDSFLSATVKEKKSRYNK